MSELWEVDDIEVARRHLRDVAHLAGLHDRRQRMEQRRQVYFDTADRRFLRAGLCLSVTSSPEGHRAETESLTSEARGPRGAATELAANSEAALRVASGAVGDQIRALAGRLALAPIAARHVWLETRILGRDGEEPVLTIDLEQSAAIDGADLDLGSGAAGSPARLHLHDTQHQDAAPLLQALANGTGFRVAATACDTRLLARELQGNWLPDLGSTAITPDLTATELAFATLRRQWLASIAHEPGTRLGVATPSPRRCPIV